MNNQNRNSNPFAIENMTLTQRSRELEGRKLVLELVRLGTINTLDHPSNPGDIPEARMLLS